MGMYLKVLDLESVYQHSRETPIVVNFLEDTTQEQKDEINKKLYMTNTDVYINMPQCQCGKLKSKYMVGKICKDCNTEVSQGIADLLESKVWMASPKGVRPFINPIIWSVLRKKFMINNGDFDIIAYLTDPHYRPKNKKPTQKQIEFETELERQKLNTRGYNNFVDNFDTYMEFLFSLKKFKGKVSDPPTDEYYFIYANRDRVFTDHIPVPNKSLLVLENVNYTIYTDNTISTIIDAVRLMIAVDLESNVLMTSQKKQARTSKVLCLIDEYFAVLYRTYFSPKPGHFRRLILGTRNNDSARTVVTSITGPHRFNEIHIPWSVAVSAFENQITSILLKEGKTPREINHFLNLYAKEYHPKLDEIFKRLIDEAPGIGIPTLTGRNPTLYKGSLQLFYVTKVKTDLTDITTSISILTVAANNADFDGDELNFIFLPDYETELRTKTLSTETSILNLDSLRELGGVVNLPKPVAGTTANWLEAEEEVNPEIREKMQQYT